MSDQDAGEPPDLTAQYNTTLSPQDEAAYRAWGVAQAEASAGGKDAAAALGGRNPAADTYDYDMRGFWKAAKGNPTFASNGHAGDQFKKPNHPTFSTFSKYNGVDGNQGGVWGGGQNGQSWTFTPSQTNLRNYPPEDLQRYFQDEEPSNRLILPQNRADGGDVETSPKISPPPGFSLVQPDTAPKPPPGFSLVEPEKTAEPSTTRDIARGMNRGVLEGVGSILGLPGDVVHMIDKGSMWALTKGAEKVGLISPETAEAVRNHVGYANPQFTDQLQSDAITKHLLKLASFAGLDTDAPTTVAGKYAHTIGSFAPVAATMGGTSLPGIARSVVKNAVIPGAASEAAGQVTEGTALEPYARVAGAIAPAALEGAVSGINRAANPLRGSMEGVTPAQEAQAQALLDASRTAGAPVTVPEAIQSATGSGTRLGDLQRVIEQSPKGSEVLKPFFAQRPEQSQSLGMQTLDQIAAGPADPFAVAPRVQQSAQGVVEASPENAALNQSVHALGPQTSAEAAGSTIRPELQGIQERREGMRSALAAKDYGAARDADYGANGAATNPVAGVHDVIAHIDDQLTSAKGATAAALRRARGTLFTDGQPDMSVTGLSNARAAITDQISVATRAGNNNVARVLGSDGVLGQLDSALEAVPEYGQARRNFAAASEPLAPFDRTTLPGQILHQDQYGNNYTMPTERIAPAIEQGGATAADQFLTAAENSPAARRAFSQFFSQKLLDGARNPAGQINIDNLAQSLRQNSDILQRFPEITQQLNAVSGARAALRAVEATPVGQLASAATHDAQSAILFNPNPLPGSEVAIGNAVRQVARTDPDAASQMVRLHLEKAFNEATQNNLPGANQFGAPKFAAVIAGNSQQAKNLEAAVRALPDGDTRWGALRRGLDIMEAMGKRFQPGSQTEFNRQINELLRSGNPAVEIAATAASPGKWASLAKNTYENFMYGRNTANFARIFTEGNVADLRKLSGAATHSVRGQAALIGALALQGARAQSPATQQQP